MNLVIDASVAAKWFIRENLHEQAQNLLAYRDLFHAPDLVVAEVANIAWKKCIRGEIAAAQARLIAAASGHYIPHLHAPVPLIERALEMAIALNHSIYDCLYIACAETVEGVLITADPRLKLRAGDTDIEPLIMHLDDPALADLAATLKASR